MSTNLQNDFIDFRLKVIPSYGIIRNRNCNIPHNVYKLIYAKYKTLRAHYDTMLYEDQIDNAVDLVIIDIVENLRLNNIHKLKQIYLLFVFSVQNNMICFINKIKRLLSIAQFINLTTIHYFNNNTRLPIMKIAIRHAAERSVDWLIKYNVNIDDNILRYTLNCKDNVPNEAIKSSGNKFSARLHYFDILNSLLQKSKHEYMRCDALNDSGDNDSDNDNEDDDSNSGNNDIDDNLNDIFNCDCESFWD